MKQSFLYTILSVLFSTAAISQDIAVGENEFRKCKACHMIQDDSGNIIVKGGKTGPNLWNVIGRPAASLEDFRYSDALLALKNSGEVWTQENLAAFITDPNAYIRKKAGNSDGRTKMTFKLNKNQSDLASYLASVSSGAQGK